ncbi:MAG: hypothetical protein JWR69_3829 [Pedosphaera sp.]|nr:hypothetical protein [Pedosphaera sp.]
MDQTEEIKRLSEAIASLASTITKIIDGRLKSVPSVTTEPKPANVLVPGENKAGLPH